jgi:hypothetical protein
MVLLSSMQKWFQSRLVGCAAPRLATVVEGDPEGGNFPKSFPILTLKEAKQTRFSGSAVSWYCTWYGTVRASAGWALVIPYSQFYHERSTSCLSALLERIVGIPGKHWLASKEIPQLKKSAAHGFICVVSSSRTQLVRFVLQHQSIS